MTGHRLSDAGALLDGAEPVVHPVEWSLADKHGWFDKPDVVIFTKKWTPKWLHTYLITGSLSGFGMAYKTAQPRVYYAQIRGTKVWECGTGTLGNGPEGSLVRIAVPILGLWTAPDETEVELNIGMTRHADQDWELANGVHNVHVVDLGCIA